MYFKDKDNTNIDNEFNDGSFINNLMHFLKKYKIIMLILIFITVSIICIYFLMSNSENVYLVLYGDDTITIYEGSDYIEPGYMAYNSHNDDLSNKVKIESNLNTNVIGEYIISYIYDNVVETRKILVVSKPKVYTFIRLNSINNNINIFLSIGDVYKEPGFQVYSSTGEDLNNKVKVSGTVDTSRKGIYLLVYSLVDEDGVTVSVTRVITVMDTNIVLSLNINDYTNQDVTINVNVEDEFFDYIILPDGSKINNRNSSYKVSSNGKYTFRTYNNKGFQKESSIEVKNIDKILPQGSCTGSYKNGISTINVNANDNIGIKGYEFNGVSYTNNQITINKEVSSVNIKIYDKAGNSKDISCSLKNNNTSTSSKTENPSSNKPNSSNNNTSIYYKREFSVKYYDSKSGKGLSYWLYIPEGATDNMPLVIYLHGTGSKGNDYEYNTKLAIQDGPGYDIYYKKKEYNTIIIMPQVRANTYLNMDELMELIDYVANLYKVNKKKISISAFSEGANQLSNKIGNNASYFSAIVLIGNYINNPDKFISIPVITMCGEYDSARNNSMKNFTNKVNELGGDANHYTIVGQEHNIVGSGYSVFRDKTYDLINWMIKQTMK